mmetsp:Transcript_11383/g.11410  ORF Transcript_11383/g.11410 Transcript_11383/m.11410 type:complete len:327 (+) Transcript_11383:77-1057(+)
MISIGDLNKQHCKVPIIAEFDENEHFSSSYLRNNSRKIDGTPVKNLRCFPTCSQIESEMHRSQIFCGRRISVSFTCLLLDSESGKHCPLYNSIFIGEFVPSAQDIANERNLTDVRYYNDCDILRICSSSGRRHGFLGKAGSPTTTTHQSGFKAMSFKVYFNNERKGYSYNIPGSRWSEATHVFRVAILMKCHNGYERIGYFSSSEFRILSCRRNNASRITRSCELMTRCFSCRTPRPCLTSVRQCQCGSPIFPNSYASIITLSLSISSLNFPETDVSDLFEVHKLFTTASRIMCEIIPPIIDDWCDSFGGGYIDKYDWDISKDGFE